eukprot:CAMPEP_0171085786 /NCGR_PEP_ID=MMETSP0766_2-20121228/19142_1 /TAXON_ID=439317 /ORGANISM="Gambierdiscus australes, Strain CAWD 149" /LENGTH=152 /DNA_ID=CAMNT_0011543377 /DNA_START=81 /DNA_END=539 /DNA_ORIENTATION=+
MIDAETTYSELVKDSLKAASMEHGLQTTAIYWEGQLNAYKGVFGQATYGQKWTWKLVDDRIRSAWGLDTCDVTKTPYVFYGDRAYFRKYYGDKDVYDIVPAKKKFNFSFFPTGTSEPMSGKPAGQISRADIFGAVMKSAFSVDLDYKLKNMG